MLVLNLTMVEKGSPEVDKMVIFISLQDEKWIKISGRYQPVLLDAER